MGVYNNKILRYKKCSRCGYTWVSRVKKPKSCPRCKVRLDMEE